MKFMIIRKADVDTEAGLLPDEALIEAMAKYNGELVDAGIMVGGEGLQPSAKGARIRFPEGKPLVIDGPFVETKELIAGYTLIETESREEAIEWVKKWPAEDDNGSLVLELRQVYTLDDFAPSEGLDQIEEHFLRLQRQPKSGCTYVVFNGQCQEAFEFYAECFGGKLEYLMTFGESPMAGNIPAEQHQRVMHACARLGSVQLMGSDAQEGQYTAPQGMYVQMALQEPEQASQIFAQLAEGGKVQMPFSQTFWAKGFGMVVDRFGIPWMINCD